MAVTLVSCYFLPFVLFFLTQIALPKSPLAFVLGIAAVSISTLFLHFMLKTAKAPVQPANVKPALHQPVAPIAAPQKAVQQMDTAPVIDLKKVLSANSPLKMPNLRALVAEREEAIQSQRELFNEELEKRDLRNQELQKSIALLQQELADRDALLGKQQAEVDNLKFEMYTLLRIDSYMEPKEATLATASF